MLCGVLPPTLLRWAAEISLSGHLAATGFAVVRIKFCMVSREFSTVEYRNVKLIDSTSFVDHNPDSRSGFSVRYEALLVLSFCPFSGWTMVLYWPSVCAAARSFSWYA